MTFSDALNPDIELAEGDPTWTVWSELLSNGDPANIGSLTTTDSENYGVKIAKGSGPGAANLATANLTPAGGHHSSLASGSRISGDLTGSLTVVRDSGGSGGAANLAVDGNVSGNLTIPVLNGLSVGGDLSGDVAVTHLLDGPLSVTGEVTAASDITVADGDGNVTFDGALAGTLTLNGGVKVGQSVTFNDDFSSNGTLDLNNAGVASNGLIEILEGGAGAITRGGTLVEGAVVILTDIGHSYSGHATFTGIDANANLTTHGGDLEGTIQIVRDLVGQLNVSSAGQIKSTGEVLIGRHLTGLLYAGEDVLGDIEIDGELDGTIIIGNDSKPSDLSGTIAVDGTGTSSGHIEVWGEITSNGEIEIGGPFSGDIEVQTNVLGDVELTGNLTGSITLGDSLKGLGRITVLGQCNGDIVIGDTTMSTTLISALGIGSGGSITINNTTAAAGDIFIGSPYGGNPLPSVTFDGLIFVDGNLSGDIEVYGCHATNDDLDICICGSLTGSITITQTNCANPAGYSCVTGC